MEHEEEGTRALSSWSSVPVVIARSSTHDTRAQLLLVTRPKCVLHWKGCVSKVPSLSTNQNTALWVIRFQSRVFCHKRNLVCRREAMDAH